jgi:hypothetical protein
LNRFEPESREEEGRRADGGKKRQQKGTANVNKLSDTEVDRVQLTYGNLQTGSSDMQSGDIFLFSRNECPTNP